MALRSWSKQVGEFEDTRERNAVVLFELNINTLVSIFHIREICDFKSIAMASTNEFGPDSGGRVKVIKRYTGTFWRLNL